MAEKSSPSGQGQEVVVFGSVLAVLAAVLAAFAIVPEGIPRTAFLVMTVILAVSASIARRGEGLSKLFGIVVASGTCVGLAILAVAPQVVFPSAPFSFDTHTLFDECSQPGHECRVSASVRTTSSSGELLAVAVDLMKSEGGHSGNAGSAIVLVEKEGEVRWRSPIEYFGPGYGSIGLATALNNHVFAQFAMTNHSAILWVIDPSGAHVRDFGSIGGVSLIVDHYSETTYNGSRRLYASREGWPATMFNPTTSRDVYEWDGTNYQFLGCEHFRPSGYGEEEEVQAFFPSGSTTCSEPTGDYSFNLPGDRSPEASPP